MRSRLDNFPITEYGELFNYLPMIVFYVKDRDGVFTKCNRRFEEMHGLTRGGGIGLTDYDLHAAEMASRYREEDRRVMESARPLPNKAWMVPDGKGMLHWWISSKIALRNERGEIHGVAGVMYEISGMGGIMEPFARIGPALRMIHEEPSTSLPTERLAAACNFSPSQFNRVFRRLIGQSPQQYLTRHRLDIAKRLLAQTDLPLTVIAMDVGFYDASVLGKKFRESEGITPRAYRLKLRDMVDAGS